MCTVFLCSESECLYGVPVYRGRDGGDALVPEAAVAAIQHRHHRLPHGHRLVLVRSL